MGAPLLSSKYRPPRRRPGTVPRRRLVELFPAVSRSALTVVSAPAGFGKSTLLTEWLAAARETAIAVAWLSLDRGDNDPGLFWRYVIAAVQTAVPGVGDAALHALGSSSTDATLVSLLNDLDAQPLDLVLVLDDYHLIETPAVHEAMAFLLEHAPPHLHVVLATRADPPLPLARMRARGDLVEVRAAELRFGPAEVTTYLNDAMGLGLDDGDVAALGRRTEGWIAALQLAALSLRDRPDVSAFIAAFAGDDRYIVDYLTEEVLAQQPADVRRFLLQTSILERLHGSLCDAVTGGDAGSATLLALEQANLFVIALDDRRAWYRYHHLFADVLRAHLLDEHADQVGALHRRAGAWFQAHDDTPQAIGHAFAAGDTDRAADLMELAVPAVTRQRREVEFQRWARALPDDVVDRRPVLAVAIVGALALLSEFDTVGARLDRVERAVRSADGTWPSRPPPDLVVVDLDNYRSLPAHISMYRAALALTDGDLAGTIDHAGQALSLAPGDDALTRAAAGALAGLAAWTTGDLVGAHAAYLASIAGLTAAGSLPDVLGCTITLGDIRRTQGRLSDALRTYRHALDATAPAPGADPLRGTADMHVGIAGVLVERDDLTGARDHLRECERLGDHNGLPQNAYRSRVVLARLREAEGDLDGALLLLDEAERVYAGDYAPNLHPVPAVRARLHLRRGEVAQALQWARERGPAVTDAPSFLREHEHLTLARLLIAQLGPRSDGREVADTLQLLDRLLDAAERGGRGGSVIEVLVLQALAHAALGQTRPALGAAHRAVTLAEAEGYVRLFTDEGRPMSALLAALADQPAAPAYANRLLGRATTTHLRAAGSGGLVDPLSERELDVLRLLGGDMGGPDIARQLSVSINTVRTHTKNIYAKLGVTSRRAAVREARDLHLIPG